MAAAAVAAVAASMPFNNTAASYNVPTYNNRVNDHGVIMSASDDLGDLGSGVGKNWATLGLGVLIVGTMGGNVLVCIAVSWERRLQNMTNYFLMSLAIADLMVGILVMPLALIVELYGYFPLSEEICVLWASLDVLMCTASIWHMCTLSTDRYLTLKYPMKYGRNKTKVMVAIKIAFVWLVSIGISSPIVVMGFLDYSTVYVDGRCAPTSRSFVIYGSVLAYFVPLIVNIVTYVLTMRILFHNQKMLGHLSEDGSGAPGLTRVIRMHGGNSSSGSKMHHQLPIYSPRSIDSRQPPGTVAGSFAAQRLPLSSASRRIMSVLPTSARSTRYNRGSEIVAGGECDGFTAMPPRRKHRRQFASNENCTDFNDNDNSAPKAMGGEDVVIQASSRDSEDVTAGFVSVSSENVTDGDDAVFTSSPNSAGIVSSKSCDDGSVFEEADEQRGSCEHSFISSTNCDFSSAGIIAQPTNDMHVTMTGDQNNVSHNTTSVLHATGPICARSCCPTTCDNKMLTAAVGDTENLERDISVNSLLSQQHVTNDVNSAATVECEVAVPCTLTSDYCPTVVCTNALIDQQQSIDSTITWSSGSSSLDNSNVCTLIIVRSANQKEGNMRNSQASLSTIGRQDAMDDNSCTDEYGFVRSSTRNAMKACTNGTPYVSNNASVVQRDKAFNDCSTRLSVESAQCRDATAGSLSPRHQRSTWRLIQRRINGRAPARMRRNSSTAYPPSPAIHTPSSATHTSCNGDLSDATGKRERLKLNKSFITNSRSSSSGVYLRGAGGLNTSLDLNKQHKLLQGSAAKNERKALKVLGIIFTVFVVFWTPFFALNVVSVLCEPCVAPLGATTFTIIVWLGYVSSLANPVIYTMFNIHFRNAFVNILTCRYRGACGRCRDVFDLTTDSTAYHLTNWATAGGNRSTNLPAGSGDNATNL